MADQDDIATSLVNDLGEGFADALTGLIKRLPAREGGSTRLAERLENRLSEFLMSSEPVRPMRLPQGRPHTNRTCPEQPRRLYRLRLV